MQSCGQGYSGLLRFVLLMDMPKLMTANNYNRTILKLTNATKAKNTLMDAAQKLKDLKNNNIVLNSIFDHLSNVIDSAVLCDDTWQQ